MAKGTTLITVLRGCEVNMLFNSWAERVWLGKSVDPINVLKIHFILASTQNIIIMMIECTFSFLYKYISLMWNGTMKSAYLRMDSVWK